MSTLVSTFVSMYRFKLKVLRAILGDPLLATGIILVLVVANLLILKLGLI